MSERARLCEQAEVARRVELDPNEVALGRRQLVTRRQPCIDPGAVRKQEARQQPIAVEYIGNEQLGLTAHRAEQRRTEVWTRRRQVVEPQPLSVKTLHDTAVTRIVEQPVG